MLYLLFFFDNDLQLFLHHMLQDILQGSVDAS